MKRRILFPVVLVAAGVLAYHNSFTGQLIHDDFGSILQNPTIRRLWPIWQPLSPPRHTGTTVAGRPIVNLSLAINYALGGDRLWGYHAFNLTIHILAGLTLLGIVRRTLQQPGLRERFGAVADELGLATAVLWTVHPLQTESVTYIIQRAESLMGLFYLLTLYCFIRGSMASGALALQRLWYALSVLACASGMACKEVMVSAPVMVMLYDRAFLSESFREAWRRRGPVYLALAGTWILLGVVLLSAGNFTTVSKKAEQAGLSWSQYLATQPGVILHYLRLSVWPHPLCFEIFGWPVARTWSSILPAAVTVVVLLAATAWAWTRPAPLGTGRAWGFIGAWFFLILAPSSSFIPLNDLIFEHRMYLSLAAVISLAVMGLFSWMGRRCLMVVALLAVGSGFLTWRRNQDYRSAVAFWSDEVARFPNNAAVHDNLAVALSEAGRLQEALRHWRRALEIKPDYAGAHFNLGIALGKAGRAEEAIEQYEQVLRISPDDAASHLNLGNALQQAGKTQEAVTRYEEALRIQPGFAEAHYNLAVTLAQLGRLPEAIAHGEQAVRLEPDFARAHNILGLALERVGRTGEAIAHWERALRIDPDYADAHCNLGAALGRAGRVAEAIQHLQQAVRLGSEDAEAQYNLGVALERTGRMSEAMGRYAEALRIKPDLVEARRALARLRRLEPAPGRTGS
jgi:tetratricopeptide (TPR) repeat protein